MSASDAIHLEVGRALSEWEALQGQLQLLYMAACKTTSVAVLAPFSLIQSIRTRIEVIKMAAHYSLCEHPDVWQEVSKFLDAVDKAAVRRNQIAHGSVGSANRDGVRGTFLMPSEPVGKKWSLLDNADTPYMFTATEIASHRKNFEKLKNQASAVRDAIGQRLGA